VIDMVKPLRAAATIAVGALAYKLLTKEDLVTDENVTNGTIGAVSGMVGLPKLEQMVRGETPEQSRTMRNVLLSSGVAALGAYFFSEGAHKKAAEYLKTGYDKYMSKDK
jgi:hypothetical protein